MLKDYLETNPPADARQAPKPIHVLGPSRLQYTVKKGESVILANDDTDEIVGGVFKKVLDDEKLVKFIKLTVIGHRNKMIRTMRVRCHAEYSADLASY